MIILKTVVCIALCYIFACLIILGCTTPYKRPCTVRVYLTFATQQQSDDICRNEVGIKRHDDGTPLKITELLRGCMDSSKTPPRIVTIDDGSIMEHEAMHIQQKYCIKNGR